MPDLKIVHRKQEAQKQVVDILRAELKTAEEGDMTEITLLAGDRNGDVTISYSRSEDLFRQLGHLARMMHVVQKRIDGGIAT